MRPTLPATAFRALAVLCLLATVGLGSAAAATPSIAATMPAAAPLAAAVRTTTPVATVGSVRLTTTAVKARGHATTDSKALFVVPAKTAVRVYRVATDSAHRPWYLVHVQSRPGWIAGWLTTPAPVVAASVWQSAMASSFGVGDGLVGGHMACGAELTTTVMAVAHRTLKCGTHVRIRVGGRTVIATVMDRGPYTSGRTFDLSPAVCHRLDACDGVVRIEWQVASQAN